MNSEKILEKKTRELIKENEELRNSLDISRMNEDRLFKNNRLLKSILENVSSGVALIDASGRFSMYNKQFLILFGLSENSTINNVNDQKWSDWQVFDENFEILHVDEHPVRKAALTGEKVTNMLVAVRLPSGGDLTWMLISAEPIFGEYGQIEQTICTYQDVTQHKFIDFELRKSEQRYRQLFNSMMETFQVIELIHDKNGVAVDYIFHDVNPAFEKLVGYKREALVNKRAKDIFPTMDEEWILSFDKVFKDGVPIRFESYGPVFKKHYEINAWRTPEKNVAVILTDITERINIQEKLRGSEELFRSVLDNSRDIITRMNLHTMTYDYVSPSMEEILGYTPDEFMAFDIKTAYAKIHPEDLNMVTNLLSKAEKTGKAELKYRLQSITGEYKWFSNHTSIVMDDYDKPAFRISVLRDITQSKEATDLIMKSEQKLKHHFENSPLGVIEWDKEYKVIRWSKKAEQIFGWIREEAIGKSIYELQMIYEEDIPVLNDTMSKLDKGNTVVATNRNYTKSGDVIECNWYNSVLSDNKGEMISVLSLIEDITERRKNEQKLLESREKYKELNDTKDKFFSIIAHDLKGPFTSIIGFSELMVEETERKDLDKIKEYAGIIYNSSWRAMDLLTNLFEWAKMQTGRTEFVRKDFDLSAVIIEATELFRDAALHKSITLTFENAGPLIVNADRSMISTVMRNLISNAVKFTYPEGRIIISATKNNNEALVSVTDDGVGISNDQLYKLFKIDVSSSTTGTGGEQGTGLGLLLCKDFVLKHGGRIWAESEPARGSTFTFTIPRYTDIDSIPYNSLNIKYKT